MEKRTIRMIIDSDLEDVALIGISINKLCTLTNLSELDCYNIELSVVEACTNAIRHAYNNEKGNEVEVEFTIFPEKSIEISIYDSGKGIEGEIKPKLEFDPNDLSTLPEGGMGIYLIFNIMDDVIIDKIKGRNRWKLIKYLNK